MKTLNVIPTPQYIEHKRQELFQLAKMHDLISTEVINASQKLDQFIIPYQKKQMPFRSNSSKALLSDTFLYYN